MEKGYQYIHKIFHEEGLDTLDDINGMLHDIYRDVDRGKQNILRVREGPNQKHKIFIS